MREKKASSPKICLVSLGCSKNLVDSEAILGELVSEGFEITPDDREANVVIVNTCGFLQSARKEAIATITTYLAKKRAGQIQALVVTGCLSQRYKTGLAQELPGVDGFFGVGNFLEIPHFLRGLFQIERDARVPLYNTSEIKRSPLLESFQRVLSTPPGYAYLKVSEGCSRRCSFCTIPSIRGRMQSRSIEALTDEAEMLASNGVKELILIGQDLTSYGKDLTPKVTLPDLLENLIQVEGVSWLRLLYNYPQNFDERLINLIATEEKILHYIDIPFQHISDKILKMMNRPETGAEIKTLITQLRDTIIPLSLRTTLMVGFPQETDEDFNLLKDFIRTTQFDNLGVFAYSNEEGTTAFSLPNQVADEMKQLRQTELMKIQLDIVRERNKQKLGLNQTILIDAEVDNSPGEHDHLYVGRSYAQAPDVDGVTYVKASKPIEIGNFCDVKIIEAQDYDLIAEHLPK